MSCKRAIQDGDLTSSRSNIRLRTRQRRSVSERIGRAVPRGFQQQKKAPICQASSRPWDAEDAVEDDVDDDNRDGGSASP